MGNIYLGFDQVDANQQDAHQSTGPTLWFTVDDLQATFDRVVALVAEVIYPPTRKPWGAVLPCGYDPAGNLLGLAQR